MRLSLCTQKFLCRNVVLSPIEDTLPSTSEVIGLRENPNKQSGVVYVRSTGRDQDGNPVLEFVRGQKTRRVRPQRGNWL